MENSAPVPACLTAARLLSGLPAVAREFCGDFTAYDGLNDVYTDDRGAPGPCLVDARYPLTFAGHASMPTGTLSFSGVVNRVEGRSEALPRKTFVYALDGCTGVFAGARGEMDASTVDGEDRRTLRFTLICDG